MATIKYNVQTSRRNNFTICGVEQPMRLKKDQIYFYF